MTTFALQLQELEAGTDRALVVGDWVGSRNGDGWFAPTDIGTALEALRVPGLSNVSQTLTQLRVRGLVLRRRSGGHWSVTPRGKQRIRDLMGAIDPTAVTTESAMPTGAEFAHAVHTLIPPFFAPVRLAPAIKSFLARYPFDSNVFCMTRFPADTLDPVSDALGQIRSALESHGLTLHLASDRVVDGDLWSNVAAHAWASRYGVAIFENRIDRGLNHNLVAEVGGMLMTGRHCALLKDTTQKEMPTDFVGQIYKAVDLDDLTHLAAVMHEWAAEDLSLGRCKECPNR